MLSPELINKILTYYIHPVAELIKKIIYDIQGRYPKSCQFHEHVFDSKFVTKYCWDCHKDFDEMFHVYDKYFCKECWEDIDSNDDVICFTAYELAELRINIHSVLYRFQIYNS